MTTVLADTHLGVMVCDSSVTDGDRVWTKTKIHRVGKSLVGLAGSVSQGDAFLEWLREGMEGKRPKFDQSEALILTEGSLTVFFGDGAPQVVKSGREAIGSGAKGVICAYEALEWSDPRRALLIVCKHDAHSRGPVRVFKL